MLFEGFGVVVGVILAVEEVVIIRIGGVTGGVYRFKPGAAYRPCGQADALVTGVIESGVLRLIRHKWVARDVVVDVFSRRVAVEIFIIAAGTQTIVKYGGDKAHMLAAAGFFLYHRGEYQRVVVDVADLGVEVIQHLD